MAAVLPFAVILVIAAIVYAAWRRAPTTAAQEAVATAISVDR